MNKLTKLLSVFVLAGAIGTGVAGAVGCNKTPDTPDGPGDTTHNHQTWSTTGTPNSDGTTHKLTCTTDGCTETKNEEHKNKTADNKCGVCGADMDTGSGGGGGGGSGGGETDAITAITITASKTTLIAGDEITLTATCTPSTATNKAVKWEISDCDPNLTDLVSITEDGGVLTISEEATAGGQLTVKATSVATPTVSKELDITVKQLTKYEELAAKDNKLVYDKDVANGDLTSDTTAGIYAKLEDGAAARSEKITVTEDNNGVKVFTQVNPGVKNTNKNCVTVINLGPVQKVEGYFETQINKIASNGEKFIVFKDGDTAVMTIIADGTKLKFQIADGTPQEITGATFGVNTYVAVYYKFDVTADKATIKVGDPSDLKTVCEDVPTQGIKVTNVTLSGGNSGERKQITRNIVAAGELVPLATYKTTIVSALDSYVTSATTDADEVLTLTSADVTAVVSTETGKINAAETHKAVDAALIAAKEAVDEAVLAQAKISAKSIADAYQPEGTFTGEAADELANVRSTENGKIAAATTIAAVKTALTNAKAALDEVLDDVERTMVKVNITIKDVSGTSVMKKDETLMVLSGANVTKDKFDAVVVVPNLKKIGGYYTTVTSGELSGAISFGDEGYLLEVSGTPGSTVELDIFVAFEDMQKLSENTLNSSNWGSGTLVAANATADVAIGTTGFKALGSSGDGKETKVDSQKADTSATDKIACINFGGSVAKNKNGLSVECGAGIVVVTVTYFSGKNEGRYIDVLNANGTVLDDSSDKKTVANGDPITATIQFELSEAGTIIIGSHSSGIYLSSLTVAVYA